MDTISHKIISDSSKAKYDSSFAKIDFAAGGWAVQTISNLIADNKYYVFSYVNIISVSSGNAGIRANNRATNVTNYNNTITYVTNGYVKLSGIFSATNNQLEVRYGGDYAGPVAHFDGYALIDLTETFGPGNEPTQEWCDEHIEWFDGTIKINY